jgi:hypothetical protein
VVGCWKIRSKFGGDQKKGQTVKRLERNDEKLLDVLRDVKIRWIFSMIFIWKMWESND